ncbi:hypothetical protein E2C01_054771 [Portunus trituberculatus]|nr:hypothetical protein [Portunus trituberculatus]
MCVRPSV